MSLWKKAVGVLATGALLATILAPAALASTSPSTSGADQTDFLNCKVAATASGSPATGNTCAQVADGKAVVILEAEGVAPANGLFFSLTTPGGAVILDADYPITWLSDTTATLSGAAVPDWPGVPAATMSILAPTSAGSTVVTVYTRNAAGEAFEEGTLTITWTATSGLELDAAKSKVVVTSGACPAAPAVQPVPPVTDPTTITSASAGTAGASAPVGCVWVLLVNTNGTAIKTMPNTNDKVAVTIQPIGLIGGAQTVNMTYNQEVKVGSTTYGGWAATLSNTGIKGQTNITAVVTYRTVANNLAPLAFTFYGTLSTITLTQTGYAVEKGLALTAAKEVAKVSFADSSTNDMGCLGGSTITSSNTAVIAVASLSIDANCKLNLAAGTYSTAGSTDITVKNGTKESAKITFYVSNKADKVVLAANTTFVASAGTLPFVATATDSDGRPVGDGTVINAVASAGAVLGSNVNTSTTTNGIANFIFVAPNTQGSVTLTAVVNAKTGNLLINVGTGSALVVTNSNKLNLPTAAPSTYTTATEVASFGQYVTWRGFAGTGFANVTVGVEVAAKNADGTWGAFTRLTSRLADANGVVLFSWRESSAKWLSVRFVGPAGNTSNAVQARWK